MITSDTSSSDPGDSGLTPQEGEQILQVLAELQAEPPPTNPQSFGCLGVLGALAALVALPWLAPAVGLGTGGTWALGVILALILVLGAFFVVFGAGFASGHVMSRVKEALQLLETHGLDLPPDDLRRATVRILWESMVSVGPTSTNTYNRDEARARLGEVLPYVEEVERFLVAREKIYPTFTR